MGCRNKLIQIHTTNVISCKNNDMISRKLFNRIRVQIPKFINFCKRCQFPFFEHLHKFHKDFCRAACIVNCAVMILQGNI